MLRVQNSTGVAYLSEASGPRLQRQQSGSCINPATSLSALSVTSPHFMFPPRASLFGHSVYTAAAERSFRSSSTVAIL